MRRTILVAVLTVLPLVSFAQVHPDSITHCLPPSSGTDDKPEKCSLHYSPPPLLRQNVEVYDCSILSYDTGIGTFLDCLVYNGSDEAVESINYGVRFLELRRKEPWVEAGFEGPLRYTTGNIQGDIQPGETLALLLVGPAIPQRADPIRIVPSVTVLSVRIPGSMLPR